MDNQFDTVLQMLQITPQSADAQETRAAIQEARELQRLILSHADAAGGGRARQLEMLNAIRPRVPVYRQRMVDVLIKCVELGMLLDDA